MLWPPSLTPAAAYAGLVLLVFLPLFSFLLSSDP